VRVWIRRYRRPLGAVLAALSVLLVVSALRTSPEPADTDTSRWNLADGQVAVPITIDSAIVQSLTPGDLLDVHRLGVQGPAQVARDAHVLRINGSSIVVSVHEDDARALVAASLDDLGVVITGRAE